MEQIWHHSRLQKLTGRTVTDLDQLRSQLETVRSCGYAIDDEENELGIRCVALAIPGPGGRADSAFSISGLAPYMTAERIRRISTLALETRATSSTIWVWSARPDPVDKAVPDGYNEAKSPRCLPGYLPFILTRKDLPWI